MERASEVAVAAMGEYEAKKRAVVYIWMGCSLNLMLAPTKINIRTPESLPASDYEAALRRGEEIEYTTPLEERKSMIRREYARKYPMVVEGTGRCYIPNFMRYSYAMPNHAEDAWNCQKAEGISMLPLFPFFHLLR